MNRWIKSFCLIILLLLTGCAMTGGSERSRQREVATIQAVKKALESKHYIIDVDMMHAMHEPSINITSDWSLEVRGDTLVSYLPYFGRAYHVPYGESKGMNFTAPIKDYYQELTERGEWHITMLVDNDEDRMKFYLEVMDNGNSYIHVIYDNKEQISYDGTLSVNIP